MAASPDVIAVPALDALPVVVAIRNHPWIYPILTGVHVLGVALVAGCAIAFDLRVLGMHRSIHIRDLARHLLRLALVGLVLVVPSGLIMFAAHATPLLGDRVFLVKIGLLFVASANAAVFHGVFYNRIPARDASAPTGAHGLALLSIAIWLSVIVCGQLLRPG